MRKAKSFLIPASSVLLGWWACSKPEEPFNPSLATTVACNIQWIYIGNKGITVSPNSTNNVASWFIKNNGTSAVTISSDTPVMGGAGVIAVRRVVWASFPFSLGPGSQIDADVVFDVAPSGGGSVGLNVSSNCGTLAAPLHLISIQAPPGTAPTVTTSPATSIGTTVATLNGSANPNGTSTTSWFRYSTTNPGSCNDTFGTRSPSSGGTALGSGASSVAYSRSLTGLTVNRTYYFCAIASNSAGIRFGAIRSLTTVRFPVGMFKGSQTSFLGMSNTPDGQMVASNPTGATTVLNAARSANARITLRVTGGNSNFQTNGNRLFDLSKWKAAFDNVSGMNLAGYVADGTLIGHYAIDEPFSDFDNFASSFLEQMCAYQKSFPGWRSVPCLVRVLNTVLYAESPAGGYQYLDAGWAQLTDHQFEPPPYNGNVQAYYQANLDQGRQVGLGLVYGFNLLQGGVEPPPDRAPTGCAWPPPSSQLNCAMTAAEIRTMADAISNLGHDKGCGIIGWELSATADSSRAYFFSTTPYSGNGVQSALQYLWSKTGGAGLRPGTCNIRGDLPAP